MIGLLQRVSEARVIVDGITIGDISAGLLVFVCAERADTDDLPAKLIDNILALRIFPDHAGKMNRSLSDFAGGLPLVPQFTLAADTRGGTRPSFSAAADSVRGKALFDEAVRYAAINAVVPVATGRFGADMNVGLINDGPVTIWLRLPATAAAAL